MPSAWTKTSTASTLSTLAAWPCAGGSPASCHAHPRWLHSCHAVLCCCPAAVQGLELTMGGVRTLPGACPAQDACHASQGALCCVRQSATGQCPAGIKHLGQMACPLTLWALVSQRRRGQQRSALCICTLGAVVVATPCSLAWHLGCLGLHSSGPGFMLGVLPAPVPDQQHISSEQAVSAGLHGAAGPLRCGP